MPVRMATIKNTRMMIRIWKKGTFVTLHCQCKCKLVQSLWKTVWSFLKKLKTELPHDPAIPLLDIKPKEMKSPAQRDIYSPMFISALFRIAKINKQPKCPWTDEWIKKIWCVYMYTHIH